MSNHTGQKAINTHHNQLAVSKQRKADRQRLRQETFEATRKAWQLQVEYYHLAEAGFCLIWLTVAAVMSIAIITYMGGR